MRCEFDLTNSMNTSVNSAHAQCFNTAKLNNHDQRVDYNMAVDKHFYLCSFRILKYVNKISSNTIIIILYVLSI